MVYGQTLTIEVVTTVLGRRMGYSSAGYILIDPLSPAEGQSLEKEGNFSCYGTINV